MIKNIAKELEKYILEEKPLIDDIKLNELKKELVEEFKKKYKVFYVGKINFDKKSNNNIMKEYNNDIDIKKYNFIIPTFDKKLVLMIDKINDTNEGMDSGLNIYIKNLQSIYRRIYELEGYILKFI